MNMKREPVAIVSAIIAVIETLIALLVAFGLKLTGEQRRTHQHPDRAPARDAGR
jgi:hypothetical protein